MSKPPTPTDADKLAEVQRESDEQHRKTQEAIERRKREAEDDGA